MSSRTYSCSRIRHHAAVHAQVAVALPNIQVERYAADVMGPNFHVDHALVEPLDCDVGQITVPSGGQFHAILNFQGKTTTTCDDLANDGDSNDGCHEGDSW